MKTLIIGVVINPHAAQPSDTGGPEVVSVSRAAALLGCTRWTVWRVPVTRLPYWTTPGGHRRYLLSDVMAVRGSARPSVVEEPGAPG